MRKWIVLILLLLASPAWAEIRISELDVIEMSADTEVVATITSAVAFHMFEDPADYQSFEFCIDTWTKETCCIIAAGGKHPRCRVLMVEGGGQ